MVSADPIYRTTSAPLYTGPRDSDPLTEGELSLLLAVPRAAQTTPDATLFRLPLGPDPAMGWIDVTCAEVYSIVSRLAAIWNTRLSELLHKRTGGTVSSVGPGTIVSILVQPSVHSIFHHLAFWALGCTVQYVSIFLGDEVVDANLTQSGSKIALYSGVDDTWVGERRARFDGDMVQLPDDEYAPRLAQVEKQGRTEPPPPWPTPRRPTPALILQSSATSGMPKLLQFSLYFYTLNHPLNCQAYLSFTHPHISRTKTPYTHPRLLFTPFYWQSFYASFFVHLTTATPLALPHILDVSSLSSSQFIAWAKAFDCGATTSCTRFVREIVTLGTDIEFLQNLFLIGCGGALMDENTSALFEKHKLPLVNQFGLSELERLMTTPRPPYTHLRPFRDTPPPLVVPISDTEPDGSRHVQLWYSLSTSPILAHVVAQGGVPLRLEPFPGDGPYHGELAMNLGDVFREVQIGPERAYVHLGRADDQIRFTTGEVDDLNAAVYEARLFSAIASHLKNKASHLGWTPFAVQVFGSNYPCTALVVQLSRPGGGELEADVLQEVYSSVDEVTKEMQLWPRARVHTGKRALVITSDGRMYGPGAERLVGEKVQLNITHKYTLQRWKNVVTFKPWLDGLDYSEP